MESGADSEGVSKSSVFCCGSLQVHRVKHRYPQTKTVLLAVHIRPRHNYVLSSSIAFFACVLFPNEHFLKVTRALMWYRTYDCFEQSDSNKCCVTVQKLAALPPHVMQSSLHLRASIKRRPSLCRCASETTAAQTHPICRIHSSPSLHVLFRWPN